MSKYEELSIYLCYLLRHRPEEAHLELDIHGWTDIQDLIKKVNKYSTYKLSNKILQEIVDSDDKGRYKIADGRIKCCQGHSIDWIVPELEYKQPPDVLYHGTTVEALKKIKKSGFISKMSRHAVHTHADIKMAWKSAKRWKLTPVVLKIDSNMMYKSGYKFGVSENQVWCVDSIPIEYILEEIYH